MVFVVGGVHEKDLLPLEVTFSSPTTLLDLRVGGASDAARPPGLSGPRFWSLARTRSSRAVM